MFSYYYKFDGDNFLFSWCLCLIGGEMLSHQTSVKKGISHSLVCIELFTKLSHLFAYAHISLMCKCSYMVSLSTNMETICKTNTYVTGKLRGVLPKCLPTFNITLFEKYAVQWNKIHAKYYFSFVAKFSLDYICNPDHLNVESTLHTSIYKKG